MVANLQQMQLEEQVGLPLITKSLFNGQEKGTATKEFDTRVHKLPLPLQCFLADVAWGLREYGSGI